ncbi:MAG: N-acetylmuramoyl-L-alanine amidase [Eubacteriales bacterium]
MKNLWLVFPCVLLLLTLIGCSGKTVTTGTTVTVPGTSVSTDQTTDLIGTTREPPVTTAASSHITADPSTNPIPSTGTTAKPSTETPSVTTLKPITEVPPVTTASTIVTTPTVTTAGAQTTPPPTHTDDPEFSEVREIVYTAVECPIYADNSLGKEIDRLPSGISVLRISVGKTVSVLSYEGGRCYARSCDLTKDVPAEAVRLMEAYGGIYYPNNGKLIAIDAGHQDHSMPEKEPLGPGSTELKAKLSSGTQGVATRIPEYELNLAVALKLRDELISRGYGVVMIRESNQVNISNAERALIANAYGADAFIRIHANGSENPTESGAFAICQTKNNPYNGELYAESRRLMQLVCDCFCEATDTPRQSDWETDTMTGINWAGVPVTILEMGYMTTPDEDRKMATDEFRTAAAIGIANGLDAYFGGE